MSFTQKDRKVRSKRGNSFPPGNGAHEPATSGNFAQEMSSLLRHAYGGRHSAVKVVAGAVGANERAVKNWFSAKNAPSGDNLLRLVIHSDTMLRGFLAMAGKDHLALAADIDLIIDSLEKALAALKRVRSS